MSHSVSCFKNNIYPKYSRQLKSVSNMEFNMFCHCFISSLGPPCQKYRRFFEQSETSYLSCSSLVPTRTSHDWAGEPPDSSSFSRHFSDCSPSPVALSPQEGRRHDGRSSPGASAGAHRLPWGGGRGGPVPGAEPRWRGGEEEEVMEGREAEWKQEQAGRVWCLQLMTNTNIKEQKPPGKP